MFHFLLKKFAEDNGIAIVIPCGENSFYVDNKNAHAYYGQYVGQELLDITRNIFPLSNKREDTFIGGNSMGGYGAIINGIRYADTFSHIVGFSSALHMFEVPIEEVQNAHFGAVKIYGDLREAAKTDVNPRVALRELKESSGCLPKIYMCCGLEDELLESNRIYKEIFGENGIDVCYEELEGGHNWEFWDEQLPKVFEWLGI